VDERLNYGTKTSQEAIQKLGYIITQNKHYKRKTSSWIEEFISFCHRRNLSTEGEAFIPNLKNFLGIPFYSHFAQDIKLSDNKQDIVASRVLGYIRGKYLKRQNCKISKFQNFQIPKNYESLIAKIHFVDTVFVQKKTCSCLTLFAGLFLN
jgi:hypothetical protein